MTFDPVVLDAARDAYRQRNDYRSGGTSRWRRLEADHPELAALASKKREGKRPPVEWTPCTTPRIDYGPKQSFRSSRIPMESCWSDFKPGCLPVCRHTADQCPTRPDYSGRPSWERGTTRAPDPEGDRLPEGMRFRGSGQVVNVMTFDDQPWLDTAPLEIQAKAGYTNFDNDLKARGDLLPGEYWAKADRKHRKAGVPKPATEDASVPPELPKDSLRGLRGRRCKCCLGRLPEDAHGNTRYCSERCRNRSEYAMSEDLVGTVTLADVELTSLVADGQRVGIDTPDLGLCRLLAGVA